MARGVRRSLEGVRPVRIRTKCLYNMWRGVFIVCIENTFNRPIGYTYRPFGYSENALPPQSTISLEVIQYPHLRQRE